MVGGAVEGEVGDVLGAGQHQRRVDLVADHPGAVAHGHVADPLELGAGVDVAERVVRLGEQQRARAAGEEVVEPVEVERRRPSASGSSGSRPARGPVQPAHARTAGGRQASAAPSARARSARRAPPGPRRSRRRSAAPARGRPAARSGAARSRRTPRPAPPPLTTAGSRSPRRHRPLQRLGHRRRERVVHLGHPGGQHVGVDAAPT